MRNLNKSTIRTNLLGSLKYVSIGALLSSTALVTNANAQAQGFQPAYPNFAYFMDNFCTSGKSCTHGSIPVTVNSTQPSVGVVIGQVSYTNRANIISSGRIVGYSDGLLGSNYAGIIASAVKWYYSNTHSTDTYKSLRDLFNNSSPNDVMGSDNGQTFAKRIFDIAGVSLTDFPQSSEVNPNSNNGGYVIWAQDIEKNSEALPSNPNQTDYSAGAAAYIALFWAGRILNPDLKIIPVPASYILKGGTGIGADGKPATQVPIPSWGLNAVVNGNSVNNYLKILNLQPSNTTDNIDLMSFMHSVLVNGKPLIDGFLGQQYSCKPMNQDVNGQYYCTDKNQSALPGEFSLGDTPIPVDKTLPYALMSAHDNPNQITYSWIKDPTNPTDPTQPPKTPYAITPPTVPWKSAYNGCLPFQAGIYWSNYNYDLNTFNPTQYLTPTPASSSTMPTSSYNAPSRRQNYGSFMLSVQVQGGSAGVNGTVTSTNTSISCSSKNLSGCTQSVGAYQTVTLVATPAPGRKFLYWTGTDSCTGNNPTCSLPVKANTQVGACFQ